MAISKKLPVAPILGTAKLLADNVYSAPKHTTLTPVATTPWPTTATELTGEDRRALERIQSKVATGIRLSAADGLFLLEKADIWSLAELAMQMRRRLNGERAFYLLNGHINYSNFCKLSCAFCSFYRTKGSAKNGDGYEMSLEQIMERADRIAAAGATEVHMVGGLHPDFPFSYYTDFLSAIRAKHPQLTRKCFTAVEIYHLAKIAKLTPRETLIRLKDAGLQMLPGGGAEILVDEVRKKICRPKETAQEWLDLHGMAHELGIPTNATMLFGHVESRADRITHLTRLRDQQDKTGGFLAFIPLSYLPENNLMKIDRGPSAIEELRTMAVSRLMLDNIQHVKAYWIMLGIGQAQMALHHGADDFDGTVMEEKIYHMAGATTPEYLPGENLRQAVEECGFDAIERDAFYKPVVRDRGPVAAATAPTAPTAPQS
ncbi:MAG: aminofutalosine synthase MqnE [Planctomycetota bacterium]